MELRTLVQLRSCLHRDREIREAKLSMMQVLLLKFGSSLKTFMGTESFQDGVKILVKI